MVADKQDMMSAFAELIHGVQETRKLAMCDDAASNLEMIEASLAEMHKAYSEQMLSESTALECTCYKCGCTKTDAADPRQGNMFACYCGEHCPECMGDNTDMSEEYRPGTWVCHGCGHTWLAPAPPQLSVLA